MRNRVWLPLSLLPLAVLVLPGASPPTAPTPEELIRQANAKFAEKDLDAADRLYDAAEERTADPGLVAFNRAAVLFQQGKFREAELAYTRTVKDRACPPDRLARALYNRGTCLLRRAPATWSRPADAEEVAALCWSAAADFARCLELASTDEQLRDDARHNLRLAKLLWAAANPHARQPRNPNTAPQEQEPEPPPPPKTGEADPSTPEPGGPTEAGGNPRPMTQAAPGQVPRENARPTDARTAGNNANLPVLRDSGQIQPLSPEDARARLRLIEQRLLRERKQMDEMISGARPRVPRDW